MGKMPDYETLEKRLRMIEGVVAHLANHQHNRGEHIETLGAILAGEFDAYLPAGCCQECGGPVMDILRATCAWCGEKLSPLEPASLATDSPEVEGRLMRPCQEEY